MNLNLVSSFGWRGEIFLFGMTLGLVMYLFVLRWIMDSHLCAKDFYDNGEWCWDKSATYVPIAVRA